MKKNYVFHFDLECPNMAPDSVRNVNKMNDTLFEVTKYDDATYSVHFITPLSCPIHCQHVINYNEDGHSDEISVCNGRGLCALDPYDKVTKCICDNGYEGELCQNVISPPHKHNDTAYIVVVILLVITVVIVATVGVTKYLLWKKRALIAYADIALRQSDLTSGLMHIKETSREWSDGDELLFEEESNDKVAN